MKIIRRRRFQVSCVCTAEGAFVLAALFIVAGLSATVSEAALVTYTIDDSQTTLTFSGRAANQPLAEQGSASEGVPGSLTNSCEGFLVADLVGSTLTFSGGCRIDPKAHPASTPEDPFLPEGVGEDNYAATDAITGQVLNATIRDAIGDILTGSVEFGTSVANRLTLGFTAGHGDFEHYFGTGSIDMTQREPAVNVSTGILAATVADQIETITIPIDVTMVFQIIIPDDSQLRLQGQIVAFRSISGSATLYWDNLGDGNWNDIDATTGHSHWLDQEGNGLDTYPNGSTDAVVTANAVSVLGEHFVNTLSVESGELKMTPSGTMNVGEDFLLGDAATYVCALGGLTNGLVTATNELRLGGTLNVQATCGLGTVGDHSRMILCTTIAEGAITGVFASEPAPGDHLGYGIFHQDVVYTDSTVDVNIFQAAPGDTDGNRQINNTDLQQILAANSFNNGTGFDWTQGDFDGDTNVDNADLQLILATGLFGTGTYAAVTQDARDSGPLVVPEQGTLLLAAIGILSLLSIAWRKRWRPAG